MNSFARLAQESGAWTSAWLLREKPFTRDSLELREEFLEPRVVAKDVVIRIVFDPIALPPAARKRTLEQAHRFFFLTELRAQARGIEQRAHVFGVELERPLRPFQRARSLTAVKERACTERERPSIAWVQRQEALGATDALA